MKHGKQLLAALCAAALLSGCGAAAQQPDTEQAAVKTAVTEEIPYVSRFETERVLALSDDGVTLDGAAVGETGDVYLSHDIVYYEDRDSYDSGLPYGEGTAEERHSAAEAAAHTVVNIASPGAYRVSGTLSAGQLRIDLGEDAADDPDARVELILDGADITCTVAPAILYQNVYECDGDWSLETATAEVDTTDAGAVLVLAEGSVNHVTGSHVARIYKDKEGEKKLWKQDGALYSYMSMNVYGPGTLELTADNEGLDTELHLTINGGSIRIRAQDDGINTNEDGVSVTTINAGDVHIIAGLGAEGDGIDSNGWLVINGGTVVASANPASDAGLDSDCGSYVNGGTVIALGSTMDWAESDSEQVTLNLQFADYQSSGSAVVITREDGVIVFAYDPDADEVLAENVRRYQGAVISSPNLEEGQNYLIYLDGEVQGQDVGGIYLTETITGYTGGVQQSYTGTDVGFGPGGMGGMRPGGFDGQRPELPEGMEMPDDMPEPPEGMELPDDMPEFPEDMEKPDDMPESPEGMERPDGEVDGQRPEKPEGGGQRPEGETDGQPQNALFYMNDRVNAFSGVAALTETE